MAKRNRVKIGTNIMEVMQIEISNGVKKEDSRLKMNKEMSAFWDKLEAEIKAMNAKGRTLDIRPEIP